MKKKAEHNKEFITLTEYIGFCEHCWEWHTQYCNFQKYDERIQRESSTTGYN